MTGLAFKTKIASVGNIAMQPRTTPESVTLGSFTLSAGASSAPIMNTYDITNVMTIFRRGVYPIEYIGVDGPVIRSIPRPIARQHYPIINPIKYPSPLPKPSDNRLAGKLNLPNPKSSPYESLTGVSTTRPEILLVTNFEPICHEGIKQSIGNNTRKTDQYVAGLNEYGEFIDAQIQLAHLKHEAINQMIAKLKASDNAFSNQLATQESQFSTDMQNLQAHSNYLRDVISQLNNLKNVYDLRQEQFYINVPQIASQYFNDARSRLQTDVEAVFEGSLGFRSILTDAGFTAAHIPEFSSTKVYFQTLYEFLWGLKGYTNTMLGASSLEQQDDANPTFINKHSVLDFGKNLSVQSSVTSNFLMNISQPQVLSTVTSIQSLFDSIFGSVHLPNDESELALLFHFLSKEYSYSSAMKSADFKGFVNGTYGYPISDTFSNEAFFDVFIGTLGSTIVDSVSNFSANSLATLGQQKVGTTVVLPFETAYVQYENNTYTPGSVYLIDNVLQLNAGNALPYNTTNLSKFATDVDTKLKNLVTTARFLNLVPQIYTITDSQFPKIILQSDKLFHSVIADFLDLTTFSTKTTMDNDAAAIFNVALKTNNNFVSLLFMYCFARTIGAKNRASTQILDTLINEIIKSVDKSLIQDTRPIDQIIRRRHGQGDLIDNNASSATSLTNILKTTNTFLTAFFNQFTKIYNQFASVMVNGFTQYSHIQDTVLMVVIFKALLLVVNKYVKKTYIGRFLTKSPSSIGTTFYSTQMSYASNSISVQSTLSKLNFDNTFRMKTLFILLSSLGRIRDASNNVVTTLTSSTHIKSLNDILGILGDRTMLQMIMNDQQINLIESMVDDINSKLSAPRYTTGTAASNGSDSTENDVQITLGNNQDLITILDDSLITENLKQAFFSYMMQGKFTTKQAQNVRLLTVGVPLGFSNDLRQDIKVNTLDAKSFEPKQTDVIRVNVLKVDLEYQDLVFKPQTFLFEMNRYVVRNDRKYKMIPLSAQLNDIFDGIPTKDYSYVEGKLANRTMWINDAQAPLFTSAEYDFLSDAQKHQLLENHVASYFFELYVRFLTGMQTSEYDFTVSPVSGSSAVPFLTEALINHVVGGHGPRNSPPNGFGTSFGPTGGQFGLPAGFNPGKTPPRIQFRDALARRISLPIFPIGNQQNVANGLNLVSNMMRFRTPYVDTGIEAKRIFTPKTFERVFTVPVDPNNFEIDYTETLKTPAGQDMFNKLLGQQRIVGVLPATTIYSNVGPSLPTYKLATRDGGVGDLMFEKYFINISTVLDTEV